ncbi:site-specific integrase [Ensifer adhaerens]|uniref:site-specific integrase n=1 Tax=Ensifer adhaerens TaxID=106592 RepID=UPI003B8479C8
MQARRNVSENMLKAYEQNIAEVRRCLRERDLAGLGSSEDIKAYIEWLSSIRKLSISTIRRRLACLRAMFTWRERSDSGFSQRSEPSMCV